MLISLLEEHDTMLMTAKPQAVDLKAKLFRGFADPSRLTILEALCDRPLTVTEIVEATGLGQSNVSNHLACLRDCGLVVREAHGRYTQYRLAEQRVETLLRTADEVLADVARGIYECTRYGEVHSRRVRTRRS
jgi:DNA-binding transcriptional ArsR family regulator